MARPSYSKGRSYNCDILFVKRSSLVLYKSASAAKALPCLGSQSDGPSPRSQAAALEDLSARSWKSKTKVKAEHCHNYRTDPFTILKTRRKKPRLVIVFDYLRRLFRVQPNKYLVCGYRKSALAIIGKMESNTTLILFPANSGKQISGPYLIIAITRGLYISIPHKLFISFSQYNPTLKNIDSMHKLSVVQITHHTKTYD